MSNKLKCEVVRDLLPLYVDKLTSEVTNQEIETHMEDCADCKEVLDSMQEPEPEREEQAQVKEVDYLKKWKRKITTTCIWIVVAMFMISIGFGIWNRCFVGNRVGWESVYCNVSVDGKNVTVNGNVLDSYFGVAKVTFEETKGEIRVHVYATKKTFLNQRDFQDTYQAKEKITKVMFDDHIIWENGIEIGRFASSLYKDKNQYIGNAPGNGNIIRHLGVQEQLGDYTVELQTKKEPYGFKFVFKDSLAKKDEHTAKQVMAADSYVMLATVENMGYVTWNYLVDGKQKEYVVDTQMALKATGRDIKKCADTAAQLQELLQDLSLKWAGTKEIVPKAENFNICILNKSKKKLKGMSLGFGLKGKISNSQNVTNADNSNLENEKIRFELIPDDFPSDATNVDLSQFQFKLRVTDEKGTEYEAGGIQRVAAKYGWTYYYTLMDDEDGNLVLVER